MTEEHADYTIEPPAHKYSIETLHHFICYKCKDWWAIADWKPKPFIYCPNCGEKAAVIEIKKMD